ncbi:MAG: hypothetical protein WC121_14235 [Candidatus Kapaibacterium sp.]
MNNATKIENQTQTTKIKRSYIEKLKGQNQHSQEKFIYQVKQTIWNSYDDQEIASSVLASIISDVEQALLIGYQLGHKHGSKVGKEKGFKDAIDIVFKGKRND